MRGKFLSDARALAAARFTPPLATGAILFGVYMPVLIASFGFKDDYVWLAAGHGYGPSNAASGGLRLGRPLSGVLVQLAYAATPDVGGLRFIRLVGLAGLFALALTLYAAIQRVTGRRWAAALIAIFACLMPPFQVYSAWAVVFYAPWAGAAAGLAALLIGRAADVGTRPSFRYAFLAGCALLVGLTMYQPTSMLFALFVFLLALESRGDLQRVAWILAVSAAVAVPAVFADFVLLKLGVRLYGAASLARSALASEWKVKVAWFWHQPLYESASLFSLTPHHWLAMTVVVFSLTGLVLLCRRAVTFAIFVLLAAATVVIAYLPSLVSAESYAAYRTQGALAPTFAVLVGLGVAESISAIRQGHLVGVRGSHHAIRASAGLLGLLSLGACFLVALVATKNVTYLLVQPQSTEFRLVRHELAAMPGGRLKHVAYVAPPYYDGMAVPYLYDEFGIPTSSATWADPAFTFIIARELGRATANMRVDVVSSAAQVPAGVPYVDVSFLRAVRPL